MKKIFPLLFPLLLLAELPPSFQPPAPQDGRKIAVQNTILAKVNGTTFSLLDVKKKMDVAFYENYPHLAHSSQARLQFYEMSWRPLLLQMIDNELILADATAKEIKLTDGEVREELESRFGPNVLFTLDRIGLTYDEAWKMVKNEMIAQRMSWWFIHSKAQQHVTPEAIRQAYQAYLGEHPAYQEWTYRVLTFRTADPTLPSKVHALLTSRGLAPEALLAELEPFKVQLSPEYRAADKDLSASHHQVLSPLTPGSYSEPVYQKGRREKEGAFRIFYLAAIADHPAPSFSELAPRFQNELTQEETKKQSEIYLKKLRAQYGFDPATLEATLPERPFSLEGSS